MLQKRHCIIHQAGSDRMGWHHWEQRATFIAQQSWFKLGRQTFTPNLTSFVLHPSQCSAEGIIFGYYSKVYL